MFKYDPTCISIYPDGNVHEGILGFFSQLFVVMVLYNCFLDVNAESYKSYSIADVLTSLSIIKKIQKLTLCNYFQATQGTGRQVTEDQAKRE